MLRIHSLLSAAVLLCALAAPANAQTPRKRPDVVTEGMTPAQVRATLGEPLRVRHEGALTYMEYPNARGEGNDYVVIRDCRVVGARFATPGRMVVHGRADTSPVPPDECYPSALEAEAAARQAPAATTAVSSAAAQVPQTGMEAMHAAAAADTTPRRASCTTPAPPVALLVIRDQEPAAAMSAADAGGRGAVLDEDAWRGRLLLRRPATRLLAVPAASISSPTAFGVEMGEAFVGVAWQARTRYTHTDDAAAVVGVGLGDRNRYVGLEVAATSYSTLRGGGPLETGALSFKLHRAFGDDWGVAAGIENVVSWGGSDAGSSPFGVITHVFRLHDDPRRPLSAVAASAGLGAGRFRSERDVADGKQTVSPFGSVGVQLFEPLAAIADWNGQDLFAGVSVAPIRRVPVVVNAGFADITGNAGDGARFILSVGAGFRWLHPLF